MPSQIRTTICIEEFINARGFFTRCTMHREVSGLITVFVTIGKSPQTRVHTFDTIDQANAFICSLQ